MLLDTKLTSPSRKAPGKPKMSSPKSSTSLTLIGRHPLLHALSTTSLARATSLYSSLEREISAASTLESAKSSPEFIGSSGSEVPWQAICKIASLTCSFLNKLQNSDSFAFSPDRTGLITLDLNEKSFSISPITFYMRQRREVGMSRIIWRANQENCQ
jgi:hypothetical protein